VIRKRKRKLQRVVNVSVKETAGIVSFPSVIFTLRRKISRNANFALVSIIKPYPV
jgi:hypothetical protein